MLYTFGTVSPINYVFLCIYNVFSLPYFYTTLRFIDYALTVQFFVHYGVCLLLALIAYTFLPKAASCSRLLVASLLLMVPLNFLLYALVDGVTLFTSIAATYVAFACLAFLLYSVSYPSQRYGYTDYVSAFVHMNLFTAVRTLRRAHFCLAMILLIGLVVAFCLENIVNIAHWL